MSAFGSVKVRTNTNIYRISLLVSAEAGESTLVELNDLKVSSIHIF